MTFGFAPKHLQDNSLSGPQAAGPGLIPDA